MASEQTHCAAHGNQWPVYYNSRTVVLCANPKMFFGLLTGFVYLLFNLIAQIATQLSYVVAAVLFIMPRQNVRGCITGCVSNVQ
jgi:hypothetical protein